MTQRADDGASLSRTATQERLAQARPPLSQWFLGALAWATALTAAAWGGRTMSASLSANHDNLLLTVHFLGAATAWLVVLPLIRVVAPRERGAKRFVVALVLLGLGTLGFCAFTFAMQYRLFYSRWHAPFGSLTWCYQFVYTSIGAAYQFAILGTRPLLAIGGPILIGTSLWLASRSR